MMEDAMYLPLRNDPPFIGMDIDCDTSLLRRRQWGRPWAPPSSWIESSWALWIRSSSLFERQCVVVRTKNAYARNSPSRVVRATPYLNFCAESKSAGKYYYERCMMALLAYVSFPNAVWPTAHELMNTLSDSDFGKSPAASVAEEPREELPPQDHPWIDCPAFLGTKRNSPRGGGTRWRPRSEEEG